MAQRTYLVFGDIEGKDDDAAINSTLAPAKSSFFTCVSSEIHPAFSSAGSFGADSRANLIGATLQRERRSVISANAGGILRSQSDRTALVAMATAVVARPSDKLLRLC
jgi:hypothetical protein